MRMPGRISLILRSACFAVKAARSGNVHLGDDGGVGGVEQRGVLKRLVLAFGHAEQRHAIRSPRS